MADSTPEERLAVAETALLKARHRRPQDLADCRSDAQRRKVFDNLNALDAAYSDASLAVLNQTGPDVEAAYADATQAQEAVDGAYADSKDLTNKIKLVGASLKKIKSLIEKATAA